MLEYEMLSYQSQYILSDGVSSFIKDEVLTAMYIESNQIIYSPSDLTLYMDSPFASWMEHLALTNPELLSSVDQEDQLMAVLQRKGIQHEKEILDHFHEKNLHIVQISKNKNAQEDTFK